MADVLADFWSEILSAASIAAFITAWVTIRKARIDRAAATELAHLAPYDALAERVVALEASDAEKSRQIRELEAALTELRTELRRAQDDHDTLAALLHAQEDQWHEWADQAPCPIPAPRPKLPAWAPPPPPRKDTT